MKSIKSMLGVKVNITTLEIFRSQILCNNLGPQRLLLDKGELSQIYNAPESVRSIAYLELIQNSTRGNHYHPKRSENLYIIRGVIELFVEDIITKENDTTIVCEGELLQIEPFIAHKITVLESGHAIEYSYEMYDNSGTVKYSIGT